MHRGGNLFAGNELLPVEPVGKREVGGEEFVASNETDSANNCEAQIRAAADGCGGSVQKEIETLAGNHAAKPEAAQARLFDWRHGRGEKAEVDRVGQDVDLYRIDPVEIP